MLNLIVALVAVFAAAQTVMPAIPQDLPAEIRTLLEQCSDPTPASRGAAAKKLGELGPRAAAAVPSLLALLSDAASYMDSIKIGTMVIHGMSSPGRQAAVALGAIGGPALDPLMKILQNKAGANRELAALALGAARDLRAVPALIAALKDVDNAISDRAHESLQELTGQKIAKDPALWQAWWQSQKKEPQTQGKPSTAPAQEPACRILSSVRADKVGGGFFTYTAQKPEAASGVVLLVELTYPPSFTSLSSIAFALRYTGAAGEETATSIGFDSLPNKDDVLDQDITWILHATSSYEIPLKDPGFDGKTGSEQMRLLFEVPNTVDRVTLFYRGRSCGEPVSIPSRKP